MEIRPYVPATDAAGLYDCKLAFERGLGSGTGGDGKAEAYEGKLTEAYRERWLAWVDRCVADDERCVTVAVDDSDDGERVGDDGTGGETDDGDDRTDGETDDRADDEPVGDEPDGDEVVGYVFCLPERLAMIWDAAVINEVYVAPEIRGTGVADDLMDAALALADDQALPLDRVVLDVDPENRRARAFYDRHGFEGWGELIARDLDDV